jgi:hypothetical protein
LEAKEARKSMGSSAEAKLEKERKREAKEIERMTRAAGMSLDARPSVPVKPELSKTGSAGFKKPTAGWTKLPPPASTLSTSQNPDPPIDSAAGILPTDNNKPINNFKPSGFKKASGFAPISSASTSGFKPIGGTSTVNNLNHFTSASSSSSATPTRLAPTFVASSSIETSFKPSLNHPPEVLKPIDDRSNSDPTGAPAAAQPPSKFAQIAARLAARKAAAAAAAPDPPSHAGPTRSNKEKPNPKAATSYDSEIEKMLDL